MARGDLNASQAGNQARGDAIADRAIETAIVRVLTSKYGLNERAIQEIQLLIGLRGNQPDGSIPHSALRRQDIGALDRVKAMKSKAAAGATPTAAEYNALRDDVRMLFEALGLIAQIIGATK